MTKIDPKMLEIWQIDQTISKKCVTYCKIPTQDNKNAGLPLKILLLVPKPTKQLPTQFTPLPITTSFICAFYFKIWLKKIAENSTEHLTPPSSVENKHN